MPDVADADPTAVSLAWLRDRPRLVAQFEKHGATGANVSGIPEAPWPCLVVDTGPGGTPAIRAGEPSEFEVTLEAWDDPAGLVGKAGMRRLLAVAYAELCALPDEQTVGATDPVVSRVRPSGAFVQTPKSTGQITWSTSAFVTIKPPRL